MFKRIIAAAVLLASPAAAQAPAPPPDGAFVMFVTANPDHTAGVSVGILRINGGAAALTQRREMAPPCTWNAAADAPVHVSDVTAIRMPNNARTPPTFGAYVATLFAATATTKGAESTPEQNGCVRSLFATMMQRATQPQTQSPPPASP